jgi:hypothetical protein
VAFPGRCSQRRTTHRNHESVTTPRETADLSTTLPQISCRTCWRWPSSCAFLYGKAHTWMLQVLRGRKSGYARSRRQFYLRIEFSVSSKRPRNCRSLGFARDDKGMGDASMESACRTGAFPPWACGPPKVTKNASVQQPLSVEVLPFPLSSRGEPRDLQFRGAFLEMFFDRAQRSRRDLRFPLPRCPRVSAQKWNLAPS